jgi:hypothetical protein
VLVGQLLGRTHNPFDQNRPLVQVKQYVKFRQSKHGFVHFMQYKD